MTKIKLRYIGAIRYHVAEGKKEEEVEIREGETLGGLINLLSRKYGERFKYTLLNSDRSLYSIIKIVIDGVSISDLRTNLDKKKEIVFAGPFPIPGGG